VTEKEPAFTMLLIVRGEIIISSRDGSYKQRFTDGMHFGEASLVFKGLRRAATAQAVSNVQLYMLHQRDYAEVRRKMILKIRHYLVICIFCFLSKPANCLLLSASMVWDPCFLGALAQIVIENCDI